MSSTAFAYVLVAACVLALSIGQVLFKAVSGRMESLHGFLHDDTGITMLVAALSLYALSTGAWIFALRSLPLSQAYLWMACAFLLVPIGAHLFLHEPMTLKLLIGSVFIVIGIWIAAG